MASTIFGATVYQEGSNPSNIRYDALGADSEVFAVGDIVTVGGDTAGTVAVVDAATEPILGVCVKKATMGATNDTVYVPYIPADGGTVFLMGANQTLTDNETSAGVFYGITGATGAQQINVSGGATTTTSRQVVIVKVDPNNVGGTEGPQEALVRFVSTAFSTTVN